MLGALSIGRLAMRFVGAFAVGLLLLAVVQVAVLFAAPGYGGAVFPLGLLLITILAGRFATGKRTRADRAVGAVAAGATATLFAIVAIVAAGVFFWGLMGSVLLGGLGAGSGPLSFFAPLGIKAVFVYVIAMILVGRLSYAGYRAWRS